MAKSTSHSPAAEAGDLLHAAWRNAKFAAQVELRRSKGKDASGNLRFNDEDVIAEAQKIFVATSANLIANGFADITGDIPHTTIAADTIIAPELKERQAIGHSNHTQQIARERMPDAQTLQANTLHALLDRHEDALNALADTSQPLTGIERENVQQYFKAAHPRKRTPPAIVKARQGKPLDDAERLALAEVVEADRQAAPHESRQQANDRLPKKAKLLTQYYPSLQKLNYPYDGKTIAEEDRRNIIAYFDEAHPNSKSNFIKEFREGRDDGFTQDNLFEMVQKDMLAVARHIQPAGIQR